MNQQSIAIPEPELNRQIEAFHSNCLKITKRHRKGYLTSEERDNLILSQLNQSFTQFLRDRNLRLQISENNWARFLEDQTLWKRGAEPLPTPEHPWLVFRSEEAAASDKTAVLQMMESMQFSTEYFQPFPESSVKPRMRISWYADGPCGMIGFPFVEDGGLFQAHSPVGKTFTLIDDLGLQAVMTVEHIVTERERACNNRINAQFLATGMVEGYTSPRLRKVHISFPGSKQRIWFDIGLDREDLQIYYSLPLWAEYHAWEQERYALAKAQLQNLVAFYEVKYEDSEGSCCTPR